MKNIWLITLAFLFFGCSRFDYRDLVIPNDVKPGSVSPESLSAEQIEYDVELLIYAFENAYGGRFVIDQEILNQTYKDLRAIKGAMTTKIFCQKVREAMLPIPDNHLHVRMNGKVCREKKKERIYFLGENIARKEKKTWIVKKKKNKKGKEYLFIAISRFPSHKSKKWNGFIESVKKLNRDGLPVVLDLRNNGGGDDTFGYRLSAYFHGIKDLENLDHLPTPYGEQWTSHTLETYVLKLNVADFWLRGEVSEPEPLIAYRAEVQEEFDRMLAEGEKGKKVEKSKPLRKGGFRGRPNRIFILQDNHCYSSCESTIDSFEYNPNVKRVGLATGGMLHFGNVTPLFLKHSQLYVQMATHANLYRDQRFIEKIGISPDIALEKGTDALKHVTEKLL